MSQLGGTEAETGGWTPAPSNADLAQDNAEADSINGNLRCSIKRSMAFKWHCLISGLKIRQMLDWMIDNEPPSTLEPLQLLLNGQIVKTLETSYAFKSTCRLSN
ncbi:predicted protein [Botrytis cinerea T4]|uniref:Uncharacterized protein n=1 Tax=Botryotinia fuckeliana (strain T4) TaxID=999810 RepID=G2YXG3_BOTF4|nr:predicted protein [Botrytis cinerea T4]